MLRFHFLRSVLTAAFCAISVSGFLFRLNLVCIPISFWWLLYSQCTKNLPEIHSATHAFMIFYSVKILKCRPCGSVEKVLRCVSQHATCPFSGIVMKFNFCSRSEVVLQNLHVSINRIITLINMLIFQSKQVNKKGTMLRVHFLRSAGHVVALQRCWDASEQIHTVF